MILVTGATGTVGSIVVRELLDRNVEFRATVHDRPLEREGVETQRIDFDQSESLSLAVEGVQSVFLVLPSSTVVGSMIDAARNVIAAARRAGVKRIVKLSAYRAGDEGYAHARWHRKVEREIERSGVAWTFLRPNVFMQSLLDEWGESIRNEDAFSHPVEGVTHLSTPETSAGWPPTCLPSPDTTERRTN